MKRHSTPTVLRPRQRCVRAFGTVGAFGVSGALALALSGCVSDKAFDLPTYEAHACVSASAGYYCVQPGDTLESVAKAFGRRKEDVAQWNGVKLSDSLTGGEMLRVGPIAGTRAAVVVEAGAPASASASGKAAARATGAKSAKNTKNAQDAAVASTRFIWPVSGTVVREFDSDGSRGIEIAAPAGTPVKAVASGRVVYAGDKIKDYGLMVIVKHDDHFVTAYGNNRRLTVAEGAMVPRGATIAETGETANGEAVLQFEMRENGRAVDPLAYLPADSGPVMP